NSSKSRSAQATAFEFAVYRSMSKATGSRLLRTPGPSLLFRGRRRCAPGPHQSMPRWAGALPPAIDHPVAALRLARELRVRVHRVRMSEQLEPADVGVRVAVAV